MKPDASRNRRRTVLKVLAALAGAAAVVGAVIGVGHLARQRLGPQERYSVRFADIDSPAPPGREGGDFLDEVQYLSGLPERVNVLDPRLPDRLTEAFGRHPKVEHVDRVRVDSGGIRVELRFRR